MTAHQDNGVSCCISFCVTFCATPAKLGSRIKFLTTASLVTSVTLKSLGVGRYHDVKCSCTPP